MIRRTPLRRRTRLRARSRTAPTHRPVLGRTAYRRLVAAVIAREGGRCLACRDPRCQPLDPHHVVKRSQGGADSLENVVALGRPCHARTDWPYSRGRLVVIPEGAGQFWCVLIFGRDKWAVQRGAFTAREVVA